MKMYSYLLGLNAALLGAPRSCPYIVYQPGNAEASIISLEGVPAIGRSSLLWNGLKRVKRTELALRPWLIWSRGQPRLGLNDLALTTTNISPTWMGSTTCIANSHGRHVGTLWERTQAEGCQL